MPRKENHVVSLASTNWSFDQRPLFHDWRLKGARTAQLHVQKILRTGYMSPGDFADVMYIQV
jgi:hypothetical protein